MLLAVAVGVDPVPLLLGLEEQEVVVSEDLVLVYQFILEAVE